MNANTSVDVLRGSSTNAYGDEIDNDTPALTALPANITEVSRRAFDPTTGTPRTVRTVVGRLYGGTAVVAGDRLRDSRDGTLYVIDTVTQVSSPAGLGDLKMDLRRMSA